MAYRKSNAWNIQDDIVRMYDTDGLTLVQIAEKVGISRPTVSTILKSAGVTVARKAWKARITTASKGEILRMYVDQNMPVSEIAKFLHLSHITVSESLRSNGVVVKRGAMRSIVYPELRTLEIGEFLELPRIGLNKRHTYLRFYTMAKCAGIKVSVRAIDESSVRVTRKS